MHTVQLKDGWRAHYNGDFSGSVEFVRGDGMAYFIPFEFLEALVATKARIKRIGALEEAEDSEVLYGREAPGD